MKGKEKILVLCMIFAVTAAHAQKNIFPARYYYKSNTSFLFRVMPSTNSSLIIPADFYNGQLGFFCKKEWRFESHTKIPLKFRIGNIDDCNRMEGKPNYRFPAIRN